MDTVMNFILGDKLRALREPNSQLWLAEVLDIEQSEISAYEHGKKPFGEDFIDKICNYFKISVREFTKPELTRSLKIILDQLKEKRLLEFPKPNEHYEMVELLKEERLRDLELENEVLKWENTQYKEAIARIKKHGGDEIYVLA